ncbi:hypothetical protein PR202_ga04183 [Eleusine coracana subsp. coracana]|uniref:Aminotransferase class V domain-containing protein n=1 Tax=Eleusine coracana subsp. coracana TaxID=191504 RepID=A0AAV5BP13_ELECO|nr:hypothetical protein PR202_ga04183 [Eleusine coracana subsp. coracana]
MATAAAAAALRYFPSSLRTRDYPVPNTNTGSVTVSSRRRHCAAAVAAPSSSLGHLTRADFPILHQELDGNKLIYFDNGATSQKPSSVIKTLDEYYRSYNSNVHRGIHALSAKATDAYERARIKVANFVNAADSREIVFTRNATEAINLVAYSWGLSNLNQGDEVNLCCSMLPIEEIVTWSNKVGAKVLVDACQSVPHMAVDVQKLGADFLVASSHKMCGPTGVGFLHSKFETLSSMEPFLGGGEMIADVFQDRSTYAEPPSRFEAGTPAIGEAIGLGAAMDYLSHIGMEQIHEYESFSLLFIYMYRKSWLHISMKTLFLFQMYAYGPSPSQTGHRAPLCSFNVENVHPTDIAEILDLQAEILTIRKPAVL